ncbi:MAG: 3-phosphoshikimate 1-carboxyvinyltransferase, partial [Microthrixaceae bacterium]|nr:3-phosphoshikimate 1-carboxyvinyltransferase [Microthrixaceae bacterium]
GGRLRMRADVSSQFLSALLLAAPAMGSGLEVELEGPLVSRPYVAMTIAVMESFGAVVDSNDDLSRITVAGTGYVACEDFEVEPDASAASYFFALAAVTGGRVRVEGLGSDSLQGDLAFTDVLAAMGAEVECSSAFTEVRGTGALHGVELDMVDISDTSPTLAAIAPLADSPTTVTGIGFVRGKETDRISSVVTELRRIGIDAEELSDGFVVHPGAPNGAVVQTYDDHRMAMSFAILGLAAGNLSIADPGCVAKTFPGFWDTVARLGPTAS